MRANVVKGLLLGAVLAVGAVGCTTVRTADASGDPNTTKSPSTVTETVTAQPSAGGDTAEANASNKSTHRTTATTTTTTRKNNTDTTTTTTKPASTGAKVVSLTVVKKPACPVQASPGAPFSSPGAPVVIAWKVTGAEGAAVSVDSPSMYGSYGSDYPASGQLELSFPCETTPGKTTHTYTVWPKGVHGVSQSISVSATNNTPA
ncbi:hypothetical protein V5P93_002855 [Actinokineospora auranticolor]|uniref:Ig-like domain-containing protein n=1 Tax=Actinokineospora auranticolor TaxID=155976 RepID=A0A2S6H0P8_9PSEU|nr:hypothetical protein [Actinokineospora auranticolor]PPK70996.1 hypothetical protein CLV40_101182 [Actinokineospora auranticolor]